MVSVRSIVQIEIQNRVSTLFRRHSDGLSNGDGAISALFNQLSIIDFRSNFLPKRRTRRFRRWSRTMTATTWRPMGIPRRGQSVMCAARMWPARVCVGSLAIFGYVFILFWCTMVIHGKTCGSEENVRFLGWAGDQYYCPFVIFKQNQRL